MRRYGALQSQGAIVIFGDVRDVHALGGSDRAYVPVGVVVHGEQNTGGLGKLSWSYTAQL